jgi:hypothetical protein
MSVKNLADISILFGNHSGNRQRKKPPRRRLADGAVLNSD